MDIFDLVIGTTENIISEVDKMQMQQYAQSRAEQSRAEQSRAEQSRAEQSRVIFGLRFCAAKNRSCNGFYTHASSLNAVVRIFIS